MNLLTALDEEALAVHVNALCDLDQDLAGVVSRFGPPPLWAREPGFATLTQIILEQQVSLRSAAVMYRRLNEALEALSPSSILAMGATGLRAIGITRQKASYLVSLSEAVLHDSLDLGRLAGLPDQEVTELLVSIKGIGQWTARIYLLMALRRPDVWPVGDIALATAYMRLKGLERRPSQPALESIARRWSPYRASAARLLWHYYLAGG
jgi:DNA-3-methyladenine glycosylase II